MIWKKVPRLLMSGSLTLALLAGCKSASTPLSPSATLEPTLPAASATPAPPTATPAPLAAMVNDEGILLADFESELQRYQAANPAGKQTLEEQRQTVLDDLVNQELLAQAALEGGYTLDESALQARVNQLADKAGGMPAFQDWMRRSGYTTESFDRMLRLSLLSAWQRDKIIAAVPTKVEQVHARQIFVQDETLANTIYSQLKGGADFATLALQYDPATGGELGWFPRGYLTQPEVDEAAFGLQPGAYSAVIKSAIGYHIVQLIERDPQRPLEAGARRMLQEKALRDWLQQRRTASQIKNLLN